VRESALGVVDAAAIYAGQLEAVTERPERELARIAAWQASTAAV
jgi:hypothetical protein